MRSQPPHQNNPANPLIKVAALSLDIIDKSSARKRSVRLIAKLNFKSSSDLRGQATSRENLPVTVSFSLQIKKTSLEIKAEIESTEHDHPIIDKVAHLAALAVKRHVRSDFRYTSTRNSELDLNISGNLAVDIDGFSTGAKTSGRGQTRRKLTKRHTSDGGAAYTFMNIAATHAGNTVHWEIAPGKDSAFQIDSPSGFLEGEVFLCPRTGKPLDACVISWRPKEKSGPLIVSGSVYVLMDDLLVSSIRFQDELGNEVKWKDIDTVSASRNKLHAILMTQHSVEKERLIRQIIRKHLQMQGMTIEGARVEICQAHA